MAKCNLLTQAQIDEICLVYDECKNQLTTSKITKHSLTTISKYLIANGRGCGQGGNQHYVITDEQILQGIKDGLTRQEIADKYGTHVENLARRMKKLGVHAKYAERPHGDNIDIWHYSKVSDEYVKNKLGNDFECIAYKQKRYRLKCKKCGEIFEREQSSIKRKTVICVKCKKEEIALQNERIKLVRSFYAILESKTPKKCEYCGNTFYSQYKEQKYCSKQCKDKNKKKNNTSIKKRCRKYGVYYDPKVTSKKVFERDRYRCMICGLACNKEDNTWNGYFGPYSPTIDHIIALANGGTHTWDNVQCAHAICNSYKRDLFTV